MKKKFTLNENDLRKIVNKVVRKKILLEVDDEKETKTVSDNFGKSEEPKKEEPKTSEKKGTGSVPDVGAIADALKSGGTDNLAKQESGTAQRAGDAVTAGATAAAVTYGTAALLGVGGGGLALGSLAAVTAAPAYPLLIAGALGAGLYYVFSEDAVAGDAVKEALDTTLYNRVSQAFSQMQNKFRQSKDPKIKENAKFFNPDVCLKSGILTPEEQSAIAQEIYDATQGSGSSYLSTALGAISGGHLAGAGTDEDGVRTALKKCKSYLGVSQVSLRHATKFAGGIITDGNLLKVLQAEFDPSDFDTYVGSVIESLPFIYIGEKAYTKSEFLNWIEETKLIIDDIANKIEKPEPTPGESDENIDNYISECQSLMNQYCENKDLDYKPIKPDGLWGARTNALWLNPYLPHVLANHPEISKIKVTISGRGRWSDISAQLISTFPGYTPGEQGCYRFCKDALSGNSALGKLKGGDDKPIKYYGRGGGGGGRKPVVPPSGGEQNKSDADNNQNNQIDYQQNVINDGRLDYRSIKVRVEIPGKGLQTLEATGLGKGTEFAKLFMRAIKENDLSPQKESTIQLDIWPETEFMNDKNATGKIGVGNTWGTSVFQGWNVKDLPGIVRRYFGGSRSKKMFELGIRNKRDQKLKLSITMPKGVYTNAVNESINYKKIKLIKELRNIIA